MSFCNYITKVLLFFDIRKGNSLKVKYLRYFLTGIRLFFFLPCTLLLVNHCLPSTLMCESHCKYTRKNPEKQKSPVKKCEKQRKALQYETVMPCVYMCAYEHALLRWRCQIVYKYLNLSLPPQDSTI